MDNQQPSFVYLTTDQTRYYIGCKLGTDELAYMGSHSDKTYHPTLRYTQFVEHGYIHAWDCVKNPNFVNKNNNFVIPTKNRLEQSARMRDKWEKGEYDDRKSSPKLNRSVLVNTEFLSKNSKKGWANPDSMYHTKDWHDRRSFLSAGENNPMYGKQHSTDTRYKISEKAKARKGKVFYNDGNINSLHFPEDPKIIEKGLVRGKLKRFNDYPERE